MKKYIAPVATCLLSFVFIAVGFAHATKLEISADAPRWAHLGADILLYAHIGGGTVGLLSGVAAIAARKGKVIHLMAGKIFLASMFVTYLIGAGVAPFLTDGQRPNLVAGILALYLLITAWLTVKQRRNTVKVRTSYIGLIISLSVVAAGLVFMQMGANSPTGTIDGSPPQAFILFTLAGSFAAYGELNVIMRKGLIGAARLSRHLWRMCVSMFIASGSLFLGQPQVFPDAFNHSAAPFVLAFAPLIAMATWLVLVRLKKRPRKIV